MSITTYTPASLVEQPPELLPLADALTEAEHQQQLEAAAQQASAAAAAACGQWQRQPRHSLTRPALLHACAQLQEQQRAEAAAAAAAAEEAAKAAVQAEYEASLPDELRTAVETALRREVVRVAADSPCLHSLVVLHAHARRLTVHQQHACTCLHAGVSQGQDGGRARITAGSAAGQAGQARSSSGGWQQGAGLAIAHTK